MNKRLLLGIFMYVVTELMSVISLFSSEWILSTHLGSVSVGLFIICRGLPEHAQFCSFSYPHKAWLAGSILLMVSVLVFAVTICFLIVAMHRRSKWFESASKWCGLGGSVIQCLVGLLFPMGYSNLGRGGYSFTLPPTYSLGFSYYLFNIGLVCSLLALMTISKLLNCTWSLNRQPNQ